MRIKVSFIIILILVMFSVFAYVWFMANEGSMAVNEQLNQLISKKDPEAIAKLSETEETSAFLMSLPEGTKVSSTTGSQGASMVATDSLTLYKVYFVTRIGDKSFGVYMYADRQSRFYYRVFPKWSLASLRYLGALRR